MSSAWYAGTAAEPTLDAEGRRQLKRFEMICRNFARLERAVHGDVQFELPADTSSRAALLTGPAGAQGVALAQMERKRLNLGEDPLDDMESILDGMGIKLVGLQMSEDSRIGGGFLFDSEVGPCIMVNSSLSPEERLVAGAHQYCHFLADYSPYLPRLCFCGEPADCDSSEERAAGFAGAFLLPEGSLASLMDGGGAVGTEEEDLRALGVYYGVPVWAVGRRLREIGVEVAGGYDEGHAGAAREEGESGQDLPRRLVRLALEARSRGLVSPLRMARLLQVDLSTGEELYSFFSPADEADDR